MHYKVCLCPAQRELNCPNSGNAINYSVHKNRLIIRKHRLCPREVVVNL